MLLLQLYLCPSAFFTSLRVFYLCLYLYLSVYLHLPCICLYYSPSVVHPVQPLTATTPAAGLSVLDPQTREQRPSLLLESRCLGSRRASSSRWHLQAACGEDGAIGVVRGACGVGGAIGVVVM